MVVFKYFNILFMVGKILFYTKEIPNYLIKI